MIHSCNINKSPNTQVDAIRSRTRIFSEVNGRRPRILLGRTTDDQFDPDLKAIAAGLADLGFDVDMLGVAVAPSAVVRIALENDVHLVGLVGISAESHPFLIELLNNLAAAAGNVQMVAWCRPVSPPECRFNGDMSCQIEIMNLSDDLIPSAARILDTLNVGD